MNHFADWRYTMCLLNANFNQTCPPCHQAFNDRVDMVHDREEVLPNSDNDLLSEWSRAIDLAC